MIVVLILLGLNVAIIAVLAALPEDKTNQPKDSQKPTSKSTKIDFE